MQNYKLKEKLLKTKPATYYRATHNISNQSVIIKKLNKPFTWQQILQSKSLTLCKNTKCKYIAKIKEIIKQDNSFYCIMENSDINLTQVISNDIERKDIYKLVRQLVQMIVALDQEQIMIRDIRPSHLFLASNKNNLKLYHFQTISEKDLTELDVTELQDMRYLAPQQVLTKKGYNKKSFIFSIGLIICQLIIGEPLINAKNKLQYIYQLTHLFPNDRVDKMKGSEHQFKQIQSVKYPSLIDKIQQQSEIGSSFLSLLERMLKVDHSDRMPIEQLVQTLDSVIQDEENFHKNKEEGNRINSTTNLPNRNQVNIQSETLKEIQFDFENKPTLSAIPIIFNQKMKGSSVLPEEQNVQDDGNQPIIIKQAASNRAKQSLNPLKKGVIQKINQTPQSIGNLNILSNTKPSSIPPISSVSSPAQILMNRNSQSSDPQLTMNKNNDFLKNSRSTKQTTLNTIKRPQLTNYAMNEANLGIKLGMNNTLFSQNNYDEEEFS